MTSQLPSATPSYQTPGAAPPPRRSSIWRWGCGLGLAGCLLIVMVIAIIVLLAAMQTTGGMDWLAAGGNRIALIRIDGTIVAGESGFALYGGEVTGSDNVVRQIERATADPQVKGILLRINSPGGSAAGAQEIYAAIQAARQEGLVVVASMADLAASGGYYVAAPVQEIFADPATLTGSIGVIVMHQDLSGLLGKLGVKSETVKSGKLKDMLTPTEPLGEEAREIVVELVEDVYDQFLKAVAEGREMEMAEVRKLADGRIFTGAQAKEEGLVDQLGGLQDALRRAGELAHIPGKPKVKEYEAPSLLRLLLGSAGVRRSQVTVAGGLLYDDFAARLASGALESPLRPGDM